MNTYLIACAGSKQNPIFNEESKIFNFENLSFNEHLGVYRKFVMWLYENNFINHINSFSSYKCSNYNHIYKQNIYAYFAWWIYRGYYSKIYKKICLQNFTTTNNLYEILILSPLWGWIKHTDYIPSYGLEMNDIINFEKINNLENEHSFNALPDNVKNTIKNYIEIKKNIDIWQLWACCFKNILNNNIFFKKDKNCCDLLFKTTNYRASIQTTNCDQPINQPISNFNGDNLGCRRGNIRGDFLNKQLNNLHQQHNNRLPCLP